MHKIAFGNLTKDHSTLDRALFWLMNHSWVNIGLIYIPMAIFVVAVYLNVVFWDDIQSRETTSIVLMSCTMVSGALVVTGILLRRVVRMLHPTWLSIVAEYMHVCQMLGIDSSATPAEQIVQAQPTLLHMADAYVSAEALDETSSQTKLFETLLSKLCSSGKEILGDAFDKNGTTHGIIIQTSRFDYIASLAYELPVPEYRRRRASKTLD